MAQSNSIEIGQVTSVNGSKVTGILAISEDAALSEQVLRSAQVGSVAAIATPRSLVFGIIGSLTTQDPEYPATTGEKRIIEIDLMGEALKKTSQGELIFQRGVSIYPGLGSPILSVTSKVLSQIYRQPGEPNVKIGRLRQDRTQSAFFKVDQLIGQHFAILGNSGSGKSCAVSVLLQSILKDFPQGHVVLLDPHDEYAKAFGGMAEVITPESLKLPYWLLTFEEAAEAICSHEPAKREAEIPILKTAILAAKEVHMAAMEKQVPLTVDTPMPYRLSNLMDQIKYEMGRLSRPEDNPPYNRIISRLVDLQSDSRFDFMFANTLVQDSMGEILSRILRIPVDNRPITILPLSNLPSDIVDVVVSLLCRLIFDFAVWGGDQPSIPLLLVCEEAHRYAPRDKELGFAPTRRSISRIAKEGRKYGVSLGLVTQRPSEVSEVILSQCNTLVIMRLSNERDQRYVTHVLPESAEGLLRALPALRTQEAIAVGEGVTLPMLVRFDDVPSQNRPRSYSNPVSHGWKDGQPGAELVQGTVDRWRRQRR
jgi:hypothetical protein